MTKAVQFQLVPENQANLASLCGHLNEHIGLVENRLNVIIKNRGFAFEVSGDSQNIKNAETILKQLYASANEQSLDLESIHLTLQKSNIEALSNDKSEHCIVQTNRKKIITKGLNQFNYVKSLQKNDLTFGVGPAGTGKTFLAVACAVEALERDEVQRLVLVRPAVEAGEKLGFLPGDLAQKVDPYLRPIYDALFEMMGNEKVEKLIEKNVIEIAPLAYMRGRTLNHSFIILDEAQNTTIEQMKMFLTRIGFGSHAVVTGDPSQIDIPKHITSGLVHVQNVLKNLKGCEFTHFDSKDVVRHRLVQRIVVAYDDYEKNDHSSS
jgi:phosphate starvation-inducible PhoH-like protein